MIEILLKDYLENKLETPVYFDNSHTKEDKFISIEKIGSSNRNKLSSSIYAIKSWGKSMYEVIVLNNELKIAINNLVELKEVSKTKINSDYNFTDEETKKYRYQMIVEIYHY